MIIIGNNNYPIGPQICHSPLERVITYVLHMYLSFILDYTFMYIYLVRHKLYLHVCHKYNSL